MNALVTERLYLEPQQRQAVRIFLAVPLGITLQRIAGRFAHQGAEVISIRIRKRGCTRADLEPFLVAERFRDGCHGLIEPTASNKTCNLTRRVRYCVVAQSGFKQEPASDIFLRHGVWLLDARYCRAYFDPVRSTGGAAAHRPDARYGTGPSHRTTTPDILGV